MKKTVKYIGTLLAVASLVVIFTIDSLFHTNLSINGYPYYINFILLLLILVGYIRFQYLHKKLILFVISTFVLQNLLISGTDDLVHRLVEVDLHNDFSFLITVPIAFIGIVIWGIIFDYLRNKKQQCKKQ
jgi:hypothetical protein